MKKIFIPLLTLIFIILSCEKESSPTITDVKPGNITGILDIYDSDDNGGANVSLKGTNISTTTNYEGRWTLTNVEPGVYDIIFSKPGYDTTEVYGFPFPGNGTMFCLYQEPYSYSTQTDFSFGGGWWLCPNSNDKIKDFNIDKNYLYDTTWTNPFHEQIERIDTSLLFEGNIDKAVGLLFYLATYSDVSITKKENSIQYYVLLSGIKNNFQIKIPQRFFVEWNYNSGTKIYCISYPLKYGYQIDLRNDKRRLIGLGQPSEVIEHTIP